MSRSADIEIWPMSRSILREVMSGRIAVVDQLSGNGQPFGELLLGLLSVAQLLEQTAHQLVGG